MLDKIARVATFASLATAGEFDLDDLLVRRSLGPTSPRASSSGGNREGVPSGEVQRAPMSACG
jgi:hypothetical protein